MRERKMRHKAAKGRKCRNGKSRKRKIWKAVCKIIICRYAYRMHELNNAAKDATVCQFTSSRCQLRRYCSAESDVDDDDNQEEEVSVDSGDDQPSADVESQDLCEVCLIAQRDRRQALVPCGHRCLGGFCNTKIEEEGRGCPICRAPITMILRLF